MKTVPFTVLFGVLMFVGCIAGPTPHPSTTDNAAEYGQDAFTGASEPAPEAGAQDDCEAGGGDWNGAECADGLDPSADAVSMADSEDSSDVGEDVEPMSDIDIDVSGDLVEQEGETDTLDSTD